MAIDRTYLEQYTGTKAYSKYLDQYEKGHFLSWNWPAFFFLLPWLAYRKLWLPLSIALVLISMITPIAIYMAVKWLNPFLTASNSGYPNHLFALVIGFVFILNILGIGFILFSHYLVMRKADKAINTLKNKTDQVKHGQGKSVTGAVIMVLSLFALNAYSTSEIMAGAAGTSLMLQVKLSPLQTAVKNRDWDAVADVIQSRQDWSFANDSKEMASVLQMLVEEQKSELIKQLGESKLIFTGLKKHSRQHYLDDAYKNKDYPTIDALLSYGIKTTDSKYLLQAVAVINSDIPLLKLLIKHKADMELRSNRGSLIEIAVKGQQNIEIITLLAEAGVNLNPLDTQGKPFPLIFESLRRYKKETSPAVIAVLLKGGANPLAGNYFRQRPLQLSIQKKYTEVTELLLDANIKVSARYYKGTSPLILAIETGQVELAKRLVSMGADPDYKNLRGVSAADSALKSKDKKIANAFRM
ncbi:MAG TPA: DUF2628 domain-containing protein [Thiotrichaceae bacterium]|nr:DUF2628 domain-containing protein [Thiotrichaceae bacterium]